MLRNYYSNKRLFPKPPKSNCSGENCGTPLNERTWWITSWDKLIKKTGVLCRKCYEAKKKVI
jgi:hypothetical protein